MKEGKINRIFFRLIRCYRKRCHSEFRKFIISKGQPMILNYLSENDGSIQKDIAKNCNIEPATATSILSTMERAGFIEKKINSDDKRIINVYLTSKGKETQINSQEAICKIEKQCFKGFSEEEKKLAKDIFDRMYSNLMEGDEIEDDKTT